MKNGPEKTRLHNSLKALGSEGDHNGVNVAFGATKDGAAATTDPIFDQNTGKYSGFNITIDPGKENNGANGWENSGRIRGDRDTPDSPDSPDSLGLRTITIPASPPSQAGL